MNSKHYLQLALGIYLGGMFYAIGHATGDIVAVAGLLSLAIVLLLEGL